MLHNADSYPEKPYQAILQVKCNMYLNSIKAFGSVHQERLWAIMESFGISDKTTILVQPFYGIYSCSIRQYGD